MSHLLAMLQVLISLHKQDSSKGIFMVSAHNHSTKTRHCVRVWVAPAAAKFDGSTCAGGMHKVGTGDKAELIGATEAVTLASILEWLGLTGSDDGDSDEDDEDAGDSDDDEDDPVLRCGVRLLLARDDDHYKHGK